MNLHTSSSHYPIERISNNDHDQHYQLPFALISTSAHQVVSSSSSSSPSSHLFFTSTTHLQDDHGFYHQHPQLYNQPHFQDQDVEKYATYNNRGGSSYEIKNKVDNGLKLTLWKKDDEVASAEITKAADNNPVKWMSSKIRLMKRMKNSTNFVARKPKTDDSTEDQKPFSSPSLESSDHLSSNSSSYNNNNSNYPIRVCSDCNTTKTPLWRSGPNGPKSLCNACGIRQRKARRAMAAAAASGAVVAADQQPPTTVLKIKVQHKEKLSMKNGNSPQIKKRCRMADSTTTTTTAAAAGSSDSGGGGETKKIGFEEFLINLSNNLSVHRVFPDEEKDAAILLMALSSGLVHG